MLARNVRWSLLTLDSLAIPSFLVQKDSIALREYVSGHAVQMVPVPQIMSVPE